MKSSTVILPVHFFSYLLGSSSHSDRISLQMDSLFHIKVQALRVVAQIRTEGTLASNE